MTGKTVYVSTDYREKQLQRALLQFSRPENANLVREALKKAGREDLIGIGEDFLVRPAFGSGENRSFKPTKKSTDRKKQKNGAFVPATDVKKRGRNQSFSQGRSKITKNGNQNAKKNRR